MYEFYTNQVTVYSFEYRISEMVNPNLDTHSHPFMKLSTKTYEQIDRNPAWTKMQFRMEEIKLQTSKHKWKHIKQIKIQSVNLNEENQATIKLVASTKNKQKKISNKQTNKQKRWICIKQNKNTLCDFEGRKPRCSGWRRHLHV